MCRVAGGCYYSTFRLLSLLCQEALATLPTSLEEDQCIMTALSESTAPRLQLAVAWRTGYKRTMRLGMQHSEVALSALQELP